MTNELFSKSEENHLMLLGREEKVREVKNGEEFFKLREESSLTLEYCLPLSYPLLPKYHSLCVEDSSSAQALLQNP